MLGYGIPYTFTSGYEWKLRNRSPSGTGRADPLGSTIGLNLDDIDPNEGDALLMPPAGRICNQRVSPERIPIRRQWSSPEFLSETEENPDVKPDEHNPN